MNWPVVVAGLALIAGAGLAVAGVYVLAGLGWSLLCGALPLFAFGAVVLRGMRE